MHISSIEYHSLKALRDAVLPLDRCTLIVGPNGSGKTTALKAIPFASGEVAVQYEQLVTASEREKASTRVSITVTWGSPYEGAGTHRAWTKGAGGAVSQKGPPNKAWTAEDANRVRLVLRDFPVYEFDAKAIAQPVQLQPQMRLNPNGARLAGVLDRLRDEAPEEFEKLNVELGDWFPTFDRILFETPSQGVRGFVLRTREGHRIRAADLSDGTLLALALLSLGYVRDLNAVIALEDPDRGIHPRLLRAVRDALYRLSYPENYGLSRTPIQVIATTHSPYFLDLFRDNLERVVIAHLAPDGAKFERLSTRPDINAILAGVELGEAWYSGVLGGVPTSE